ncbi:pleckstrin homology domain-containing family G member 3 [Cheilinus undulatus]|uniref:pleckstrin homology domain-containing family G member 3 n=1 Tax=Cheilinus undulatus TaxID=241271 RepID=UPI001BD5DE43|nr:pleckstrin homology domain-containing family G member 3 [Cheilinus undulatus]
MPEDSLSSSHGVPMDEESPRLSTASVCSNERAPSATPSDSSEPRPLSLISTLSSGSGSSRDDNQTLLPTDHNPDGDPDLNSAGEPERKGLTLGVINNNNNNKGTFIMAPQLTYLDRVVMEIIETERMYVRDLRMIVEDYLAHIIDQCDLSIRPEQVCALFGNIEDIYEFNSELLQALDLCDNDPVAVARCFVMKSEYFEIYTQYCTNYPNSVAALTECMRNKSLAKFFRERQASLKCSLPLGSYLLKPVQRILKYHLLLQEIAKHFDPLEEGYEVVEDAIYTMTGVAWYINDMKRKHEHAVRLQEVQSLLLNWKGPDLTTYGELVLEGTFKVHRAKNERTLFLFDRMLLITKRRGEHFVYKTHISCSTLMLIESAKDSLSFSVTHYKHPKQPHTVQAKTVEERKLWAHHIKRIILENHHAIIPQKAKDAILEMNPTYPPRYRYSPERLKKASDGFQRDRRQGRRQSEPNKSLAKSSKDPTANLKDVGGGSVSANSSSKENIQLPEEDEAGGAETTCEQSSSDMTPKRKTSKQTEIHKPDPTCDSDSLSSTPVSISASPQTTETTPERDPEHVERRSSATPDSDSKTLSSAESSEDEEDEKEATQKGEEATSILPSSVLDKASAIAQHFTNSIKRGSVAQDDARSLGCASPRLLSRNSSSLSLCPESSDRMLRVSSAGSDPPETFGVTDLTLLSPRDDSLFDSDRSIRRRRDSTLSKQDQMLIGKIKSYYENAENQDATFSLQRRESLTYIPTGLVRSSVSRFNSSQKDEIPQTNPSDSTTSPSTAESNSALPPDTKAHVVTDESLDPLKSELVNKDPEDSGERNGSIIKSVQDSPFGDEEFRPSSEMIKIWQTMEQEMSKSQSENRGHERLREVPRTSKVTFENPSETSKTRKLKESMCPSAFKHTVSGVTQSGNRKIFIDEAAVHRAPVPRVAQLRAEVERERPSKDSNQLDEVDKTKSKVLHLARQYSQRIKTTNPVVRQRSQGFLIGKKSLPCVIEEKETSCLTSGKPNLTLPLAPLDQASSLPLSPLDQTQPSLPGLTGGLMGSSKVVSPSRGQSCSPLSPPPIESFNWPDVRELRSMYSNPARSQRCPVGRSRSIPEQMSDGGLRRHSSHSSSLPRLGEAHSSKPHGHRGVGREERAKRLLRANSLDPRLSAEQMSELEKLKGQAAEENQDGYYVAAEAILPNDPEHKIIIMEKLPEPESEHAETAKESNNGDEEEDDSYIQIRSPTSREKISIMAVIDRCRAYQESDEYKQREDVRAKTEPTRPQEPVVNATSSNDEDDESQTASSGTKTEAGQQSIVRNLREKFQNMG